MKYFFNNQQEKAQLYFATIVFINFVILCIVITGIAIGIKGYISDTKSAYDTVTCCGSICLKCFFTLHTFSIMFPWCCIIILFVGICMAIHKTCLMLSRNYTFTLSTALPVFLNNHPKLKNLISNEHLCSQVVLLDNAKLRFAFTSGIWKPKIYLSKGICSYLTIKELLAVILHEKHHKDNNVPLKLFIIQVLYALNFFLPINHYLLNLFSVASEKAADDNAVNFSREPLELASALVKLSKSNAISITSPHISFYSRREVLEDRIKRLLEPQGTSTDFGKARLFPRKEACFYLSCLLSFFVMATIFLSLFYKPVTSNHTMGCKTKMCRMVKCG